MVRVEADAGVEIPSLPQRIDVESVGEVVALSADDDRLVLELIYVLTGPAVILDVHAEVEIIAAGEVVEARTPEARFGEGMMFRSYPILEAEVEVGVDLVVDPQPANHIGDEVLNRGNLVRGDRPRPPRAPDDRHPRTESVAGADDALHEPTQAIAQAFVGEGGEICFLCDVEASEVDDGGIGLLDARDLRHHRVPSPLVIHHPLEVAGAGTGVRMPSAA